jgi:type IV pilus assembly protein PilN
MTVACTLILAAALAIVGWRYLSVSQASSALDAEIARAQEEGSRLRPIIQQVQAFEARKAELQQRVALIEQLRREQTGPVHMLDQISRALPPMLWLTELKQENATDVVIHGRSTSLTSLSDFVSNLERSGYFRKSVEILRGEASSGKDGELVDFSLRAAFQPPGPPPPAPKRNGGQG